jgi:hypothetical protein
MMPISDALYHTRIEDLKSLLDCTYAEMHG